MTGQVELQLSLHICFLLRNHCDSRAMSSAACSLGDVGVSVCGYQCSSSLKQIPISLPPLCTFFLFYHRERNFEVTLCCPHFVHSFLVFFFFSLAEAFISSGRKFRRKMFSVGPNFGNGSHVQCSACNISTESVTLGHKTSYAR